MDIYVWGTGRALGAILDFHLPLDRVTAFVDNNRERTSCMGKQVIRPEELSGRSYDAVVVACDAAAEIEAQSRRLGIDPRKMIFCFNNQVLHDRNHDYELVTRILGPECARIIRHRYRLVPEVEADELNSRNRLGDTELSRNDHIRTKTLELLCAEICGNHINGAVAEVGVFRGEFAALINRLLPDRKLYLFDTFAGFDPGEADEERQKKHCNPAFIAAFRETSIQTVMEKMEHPDQIVLRPGLFPQTAAGIDEHFSLVSIDVDFEKSTLAGLEFFYPRLVHGGSLMVHDYNSRLTGVATAVARFEQKIGRTLAKVPICDRNGTLVITR